MQRSRKFEGSIEREKKSEERKPRSIRIFQITVPIRWNYSSKGKNTSWIYTDGSTKGTKKRGKKRGKGGGKEEKKKEEGGLQKTRRIEIVGPKNTL